jgi:acyl-CoA thioesterase
MVKHPDSTTPFNQLLGTRCVLREPGRTRYEMEIGPDHLNKRGVAHGGVAASLLDTALGAAVITAMAPEEWTGTLELSIQYREPLWPGTVVAEGRVARRGRTAAFAEGEIRDSAGRVLAVAHGVWTIWPSRPAERGKPTA